MLVTIFMYLSKPICDTLELCGYLLRNTWTDDRDDTGLDTGGVPRQTDVNMHSLFTSPHATLARLLHSLNHIIYGK
jgi:hypothetical protein